MAFQDRDSKEQDVSACCRHRYAEILLIWKISTQEQDSYSNMQSPKAATGTQQQEPLETWDSAPSEQQQETNTAPDPAAATQPRSLPHSGVLADETLEQFRQQIADLQSQVKHLDIQSRRHLPSAPPDLRDAPTEVALGRLKEFNPMQSALRQIESQRRTIESQQQSIAAQHQVIEQLKLSNTGLQPVLHRLSEAEASHSTRLSQLEQQSRDPSLDTRVTQLDQRHQDLLSDWRLSDSEQRRERSHVETRLAELEYNDNVMNGRNRLATLEQGHQILRDRVEPLERRIQSLDARMNSRARDLDAVYADINAVENRIRSTFNDLDDSLARQGLFGRPVYDNRPPRRR